MDIETRKIWKAGFPSVLRLARWLGMPTPPDDCACLPCHALLIDKVKRRISENHVPV